MKTGILTLHDGVNHGAFLQVYALQNCLKRLGMETWVIDYRTRMQILREYKILLYTKSLRVFLSNLWKIVRFKKYLKRLHLTPRVTTAAGIGHLEFDQVVIGSDEVWNYRSPVIGLEPVYFGIGIDSCRKIAYAPSFGTCATESSHPKIVMEGIVSLNAVSIRDNVSKRAAELIRGGDVEIVLDPTFLYDFPECKSDCPHNDFILVYSTGLSPERVEEILRFAKKREKKLISIGYFNPWCSVNLVTIDPFHWIGYFKKAEMVITSTFHGTIFSIKYGKPFVTIVMPYWQHKIETVLENFGLLNRLISREDQTIEEVLVVPVEYYKMSQIIEKMIDTSWAFLSRELQASEA